MRRRPLLVLLALLAACGDDAGDACDELGVAVCARSSECGLLDPSRVDWCVGEFERACAEAPPGDDQVVACAAALPAFDCDELAAGELPPECER